MTLYNPDSLNHLINSARDLAPLLRDSMEQTFAQQSHYRWEGLEPISQSTTMLCSQVNDHFKEVVILVRDDETLRSKLPNHDLFIKHAKILMNDLGDYSNRLNEIHSKHQDMTGVVKGGTQVAAFVGIWESYLLWLESFNDVVLPLFSSLYGDVHYALTQDTVH